MIHDGVLQIATGVGANSRSWKNNKFKWSYLVDKLKKEYKTSETLKEFLSFSKEDQGKIKDVGGYVGGYLRGGRRKPANVVTRQLLTLDIDFAHNYFWDDFTLFYDNAAVLHGTHKHSELSPRYRLVMPLSREASPDEYVAVARAVAGQIGIDLFDATTFQTSRLMFWPSNPVDVDYYCEVQDGVWLDVDEVLSTYTDWTDSSLWPTAERDFQKVKDASLKQEDPETKRGVIGAWCRAYTITEVIENFLVDDYKQAGDCRYTYTKGTAAAGLVVYEDKFAFSHHGTDPTGGKLCNAFDLVRIHRFGHLDQDTQKTASHATKSFKAMEDFARLDKEVLAVIALESIGSAKYDFTEDLEEGDSNITIESIEWAKNLEVDTKGKYLSTANNLNLIFANDSRLKGLFKQNDFDGKRYVFGSMPWRKVSKPEPVKNVDYSGVRNYIESVYGIAGNLKIDDSLALEFEKQSFHPVKDYLKAQNWDGTLRVDNLLIDYLGAANNEYTKQATRKVLAGAVARIMNPGVKFDLVITLIGAQGIGKSTILKKLGRDWFSDTFMSVQGKEALEQIQGSWLIEMAELSGLRKAEAEAIKHFISKQEDTFRPAYARTAETYRRQNIFIGTSNKRDYLTDPTGNRRHLPIDLDIKKSTKDVFSLDDRTIGQIWAEAVMLYKSGEPLFLSGEAALLSENEQKKHREADERIGLIVSYLDVLLPENWGELDIYKRREHIAGGELIPEGKIIREVVCVAEVWCECLNKDINDMDRYKTRDINEILRSLDGWEQSKSTKNFGRYGKQKYYSRE